MCFVKKASDLLFIREFIFPVIIHGSLCSCVHSLVCVNKNVEKIEMRVLRFCNEVNFTF